MPIQTVQTIADILQTFYIIDIDVFRRGLRESNFTSGDSKRISSYTKFAEILWFDLEAKLVQSSRE
jgi:hypothetical protein